MNPTKLSLNPSSIKSRFTRGFLRSLMRINKQRPTLSICRRYCSVKIAADASMADAVGSRRAWSRAMLWKIRNQSQRRGLVRRISCHAMRKRDKREDSGKELGYGRANKLRKLVPGGEVMDFCSLLGETAHYIKCLTTQVQVMTSVADLSST